MSKKYIVESEKFLAENEMLGESNSNDAHGSQVEKKTCVHHWLIEPPNGETSSGTCKLCGEFRKDYFFNSMENSGWDGRKPKKRVPRSKTKEKRNKRTMVNEIKDEDLR